MLLMDNSLIHWVGDIITQIKLVLTLQIGQYHMRSHMEKICRREHVESILEEIKMRRKQTSVVMLSKEGMDKGKY
jgi:hypothetical protein